MRPCSGAFLYIFFILATFISVKADTVAFFYALDKDFEMLKAEGQVGGQSLKVGSHNIPVLQIASHRVFAIKMGSGVVETAASTQALLARVKCDEAFSVGPVGEISDHLKPGSWHRVESIICYQKGSWTKSGFEASPGAEMEQTNAIAATNLPGLFLKLDNIKVASGEIFVASDSYRTQLRETTKADAVDMNLFGLAMVCMDHHLPLTNWRVVSDHADENAGDDFKKFVASYDGAGGRAVAEAIKNLSANPNSPESYPNLKKLLSP
ncbi:MAG: hypothetical protein P4N60_16250 [Verrucomicrobiae bacterium]|nr:hypothetical protein [Verrucomicrobiae bacterium]